MTDDTRTLDDLLDGERMAMVVTADQRARPMTILDRDEQRLWFLTSRSAAWVQALPDQEFVALTIVDPADSLYLSLTAKATTTTDAEVLERLWSAPLEAWFDGADDPDLIALAADAVEGEYWDGPDSSIGRTLRGLAAVVTGRGPELMGEQGDVRA